MKSFAKIVLFVLASLSALAAAAAAADGDAVQQDNINAVRVGGNRKLQGTQAENANGGFDRELHEHNEEYDDDDDDEDFDDEDEEFDDNDDEGGDDEGERRNLGGTWCAAGYLKDNVCCASSCGRCGGSGCGKLSGGSSKCCTSNILSAGRVCENFSDTACIVGGAGGTGESAYVNYHIYTKGQSLTQVACSDGANGLITRWGYSTLDPMFPYVAAVSWLGDWNSPNCGKCYSATSNGKTIYFTAIDQRGTHNGGKAIDMSKEAFLELFGTAGINAGHGYVTYKEVEHWRCKGNKG